MPTAYVFINYEIGAEQNILNKLKTVPGVIEASEVNGVYDIVVKMTSDSLDKLKEIITRDIRTIYVIRSTMTLIVVNRKIEVIYKRL
jgi:DNA-binding Lrp family transcriptional regulator